MAAKNRKRYLEYQEFKEYKAEKAKLRRKYKTLEALNRGVFEQFVELVRTGQMTTFEQMADFDLKLRVGSLRMALDELDQMNPLMFTIPNIHFKEGWNVKVLPGYMGAFARFRVNDFISIYLDMFDRLGYYGSPYWELHDGSDTLRFSMEDTEGLLSCINQLIEFKKLPVDIQELMQKSEEE